MGPLVRPKGGRHARSGLSLANFNYAKGAWPTPSASRLNSSITELAYRTHRPIRRSQGTGGPAAPGTGTRRANDDPTRIGVYAREARGQVHEAAAPGGGNGRGPHRAHPSRRSEGPPAEASPGHVGRLIADGGGMRMAAASVPPPSSELFPRRTCCELDVV